VDNRLRDKALRHFPYALLVVGSGTKESVTTIVANWASQVSFSPSLIAIAIEDDSRIRQIIEASGFFSINLLPANRPDLVKAFLKPREVAGIEINGRGFRRTDNGTPFLNDALASLECRVIHAHPTGDHVTLAGEVSDAAVHLEGDIMTLKESGLRYLH